MLRRYLVKTTMGEYRGDFGTLREAITAALAVSRTLPEVRVWIDIVQDHERCLIACIQNGKEISE